MAKKPAEPIISFSQPVRQIVSMLIAIGLAGAGGWLIHDTVLNILGTNPALNGFILGVFFFGILTCFWQVFILVQSVSWIERFLNHAPGHEADTPPRLLAPLAALLRSRGARSQISSTSSRSILDSVATRIDEARDITRYLVNLLIFLGLLGTFYGLATTIPAIVETIKSLAPKDGETGLAVFERLMSGLQAQLGGMSTAFSSSLLGLAGSLLVGLLELFASHGQNRFYRELEDWLSSITRLGLSSGEGDSGDQAILAQILDNMTGQIEVLQTLYANAEANREQDGDRMGELAASVHALAGKMDNGEQAASLVQIAEGQERMIKALVAKLDGGAQAATLVQIADGQERMIKALAAKSDDGAQTATLTRIADGQERLVKALTGTEASSGGAYTDAESRMRLRSIDVQLLRILEEISAGRQESIADLRSDLTALTQAIRALSRGTVGRG